MQEYESDPGEEKTGEHFPWTNFFCVLSGKNIGQLDFTALLESTKSQGPLMNEELFSGLLWQHFS